MKGQTSHLMCVCVAIEMGFFYMVKCLWGSFRTSDRNHHEEADFPAVHLFLFWGRFFFNMAPQGGAFGWTVGVLAVWKWLRREESTLFGVLVVQIKPQLEKLLNLHDDSLTKETAKQQENGTQD